MTVVDIVLSIIRSPMQWFSHLLDKSGMTSLFLGIVMIFMVYRYLLVPLFGSSRGRGSDTAKKRKDSSEDS